MYHPYPQDRQRPPAPPASILTAVKLMYAGAAVSVLSLVVTLGTIGSFRTAIRNADPALSATRLHATQTAAVVVAVLFGLIGAGLWIWMAAANKAGKGRARITASIIFGLDTLAVLADFSQPEPSLSRLISGVIWLIGLCVIVLLWRRQSSEHYTAARDYSTTQ